MWEARGFALGVASHGIGTARAFQVSEDICMGARGLRHGPERRIHGIRRAGFAAGIVKIALRTLNKMKKGLLTRDEGS